MLVRFSKRPLTSLLRSVCFNRPPTDAKLLLVSATILRRAKRAAPRETAQIIYKMNSTADEFNRNQRRCAWVGSTNDQRVGNFLGTLCRHRPNLFCYLPWELDRLIFRFERATDHVD
jgi:hypothetical protein